MRAVLVLGGDPPTARELEALASADLVVATDGGATALLKRDLLPHRIVGDMDSLSERLRQYALARDVPLEVHPREKAETDGELAMAYLLEKGPDEILVLGGHGGRSAMFLTHLTLLCKAAEAGMKAVMRGHNETIMVLLGGQTVVLERGGVLDLVALQPAVVDLEGTAYDAHGYALGVATGQGLSNEVRRGARVHVRSGEVVVVLEAPSVEENEGPAFKLMR